MSPETDVATAGFSSAQAPAWLRNISTVVLASVFVAVCAHIALPLSFTPVPLTLQPFAVLLLGMMLSPRLAGAGLLAYLAEGAAGLPVFTPGVLESTGLAHLFGPTGGYLLSYPIAAYLIAALWRNSSRSLFRAVLATVVGNLLILLAGAIWLTVFTHAHITAVFFQAVAPFLPGDALKVTAAAIAGYEWNNLRPNRRSNHPTV